MQEDLKAIRNDLNTIKVDIAGMKVDVHHHIKRSDATDQRLLYLERAFITLAVVAVLGGVVKLLIS